MSDTSRKKQESFKLFFRRRQCFQSCSVYIWWTACHRKPICLQCRSKCLYLPPEVGQSPRKSIAVLILEKVPRRINHHYSRRVCLPDERPFSTFRCTAPKQNSKLFGPGISAGFPELTYTKMAAAQPHLYIHIIQSGLHGLYGQS